MTNNKKDMFDFDTIVETCEVEMKKAAGRDGKGAVPDSIWETYSAMANTRGGVIILGAEQISDHVFKPYHLENAEKMVRDFWAIINDSKKISKNILHENNVQIETLKNGEKIIVIRVPQATRTEKPIFINNQLMGGTYKRYNEGDFCCPDAMVKQMLGEQVSETMDDGIICGYGFEDIDLPTFNAYRQRFSNNKPDHPFNILEPLEFLRQIGGYKIDRISGQAGLTLAGLLMFGKLRDILDNVPNYVVDYQERPRAVTEMRWVDRVSTDFSWPGNLFSFYQIVIKKLFADLKVPFQLENATTRVEDTPVHKAIREAFVNTLIHADYSGKCSILVVKRPDLFGFRNPGIFRLPKSEALRGGSSDCRNRNLQKMFQLIELAEQAGSGIPKIYYGWNSQDWKHPEYEERIELNQTILALRMSNLLPEETVDHVQKILGLSKYRSLNKLERLAVVTAFAEGCVNHERLKTLTTEHSADISATLRKLLQKKILATEGHGQATIYYPVGHPPINDDISCCAPVIQDPSENKDESSNSHHNEMSFHHSESASSHFKDNDRSSRINDVEQNQELLTIAAPIRAAKRVSPTKLKVIILKLCKNHYLSVAEIAFLLKRQETTVRNNYLPELCDGGFLQRRYPMTNDPRQQYITDLNKFNDFCKLNSLNKDEL